MSLSNRSQSEENDGDSMLREQAPGFIFIITTNKNVKNILQSKGTDVYPAGEKGKDTFNK